MAELTSTRRRVLGSWLVIGASALHVIMYLVAAPEHVVDESWPPHARFHVLQAIFWIVGADLAAAALAVGLRQDVAGSRIALAVVFVFTHGAYYIALAAMPAAGPPELSSHLLLAIPAVLYLAGLAIAWKRTL